MNRLNYFLTTLPIALLAGCGTALDVKEASIGPQNGIVYALPMTQFDIEVTRRIASCDNDSIKIATAFELTKKSIEDASNVFVLDPASLSHFWNKASTEVKFHEGGRRIKSFNGAVVDNAGPAVISVVKAVAGILSGSLLLDVPEPELIPCKDGIEEMVISAATQKGKVTDLTKVLNEQTLKVSRVSAKQSEQLPGSVPEIDLKVAAAVKHLKTLKAQIEAEEKALKRALKLITFTQKITWPEDGSDMARDEPISMSKAALEKWVGLGNASDKKIEDLDINVSLEALSSSGRQMDQPQRTDNPGLYYRTPAQGAVIFKGYNLFHKHYDTIAQLGYVNSLLIEAGPFESIEFSAEYDKDGGLTSAGYKQTASASAAVSSILDAAVADFKALAEQKSGEDQAKLDAELKRLQAEVAIAEANEVLNPPETSDDVKALEAMNAETDLLNAQIARLEAEQKLGELQKQ